MGPRMKNLARLKKKEKQHPYGVRWRKWAKRWGDEKGQVSLFLEEG